MHGIILLLEEKKVSMHDITLYFFKWNRVLVKTTL